MPQSGTDLASEEPAAGLSDDRQLPQPVRRHAQATLPRSLCQCCGKCHVTSARSIFYQAAGSRAVIDLHGRLDLTCSVTLRRTDFQDRLVRLTVAWTEFMRPHCRMATPISTPGLLALQRKRPARPGRRGPRAPGGRRRDARRGFVPHELFRLSVRPGCSTPRHPNRAVNLGRTRRRSTGFPSGRLVRGGAAIL